MESIKTTTLKMYLWKMEGKILDSIQSPKDLRQLPENSLPSLAKELREFIIKIVAREGGHLGASLGTVELTLALHYIFNTPQDVLIWDVGHQAYGHKIITGRYAQFKTNRKLGGLSGFPKRDESIYDAFGTGHSSTAISAALGMALAKQLQNNPDAIHIAVVGDASIANGMAFEALNHAGVTQANLLVVLNDNAIGIDPSVGALKNYFSTITAQTPAPKHSLFEALNFKYSGPIDGHDLQALCTAFSDLKKEKGPRLLHVVTKKGKGLKLAEDNQVLFHAPGKFDPDTGVFPPKDTSKQPSKFQDVFGLSLLDIALENNNVIAITPAMPTGSALTHMMQVFPKRVFDVGIAEAHAVTLAAGMATQGLTVFCVIYSTFLQRAYDQVIHDVCLQNLPVIFCIDRAGLVGEDGPTHHGIFDIAYLRLIPNIQIYAPHNETTFRNLLYTLSKAPKSPMAIRYPRGLGKNLDWKQPLKKIALNQTTYHLKGEFLAIISLGTTAWEVVEALENSTQKVTHVSMLSIKPLDTSSLHWLCQNHNIIITVEDGVITGGFGSAVLEFISENNYKIQLERLGIKDNFPTHGSISELKKIAGIDASSIRKKVNTLLQKKGA